MNKKLLALVIMALVLISAGMNLYASDVIDYSIYSGTSVAGSPTNVLMIPSGSSSQNTIPFTIKVNNPDTVFAGGVLANQVGVQLIGRNNVSSTFTAVEESGNRVIKGHVNSDMNSYTLVFTRNGIPLTKADSSSATLNVHDYFVSGDKFVRYNMGNQVVTELKLNESELELQFYLAKGTASSLVTSIVQNIVLDGASYAQAPTFNGSGLVTIRFNQLTAAGKGALKLTIDNVVVKTWDVTPSTFPGININPGIFYVDNAQPIFIRALAADSYYSSSSVSLVDMPTNQVIVELSGVPIAQSSVRGLIDGTLNNSYYPTDSTYSYLKLYASDLENSSLEFTNSGTLKVKLTSVDGRYISEVDLRVERGTSDKLEGLVGELPYQNYAGDSTLNIEFRLPSNRSVREYTATITPSFGDTIEMQNSSNSSIYNLPTINFVRNGRGSISVAATTIDRDYDQRDWYREFTYTTPSLEVSDTVINLDDELTFTVFLRDALGNAINNATVTIDGLGQRNTARNGEYVFSNIKWTSAGFKRITAVASDGSLLADFSKLVEVRAPELLSLHVNNGTLIAGISQTLSMAVYDENGKEMTTNARVRAFVDNSTTSIQSNYSSQYREHQVRVQPTSKVVLRAESSDGRKISPEVMLEVVIPEVRISHDALTNMFMDHLEFSFFNPITGEPISGTVALRAQNVQIVERNIVGATSNSKTGTTVSLDLFKRVQNGTAEPVVYVDFTYSGKLFKDVAKLPVLDAKVKVTPETLRQGVREELSVEILGASGHGLEDVAVTLQGSTQSADSKTNASGKASFNITPGSGVQEYTLVITRADQPVQSGGRASTFEVKVPVDRDTTDPVVTIAGVNANNVIEVDEAAYTLEITMSDDAGLDTLTINTKSVTLDGKEFKHSEPLTLRAGDNQYTITVRDKASNSVTRTVNIRYTEPVKIAEPITMTIGSYVVRQGNKVLAQPPQVPAIIGGRTMLPFRYLVQTVLGGMVNYDDATRSITAYVNGHQVDMVVDSPTIRVDGQVRTLDQPPVVIDGSTLVPIRAFDSVVSSIAWDSVNEVATIYP